MGATKSKVYIETFGCQMNELDTELVREQLLTDGYDFVSDADQAQIVLYNTCSVRDLSEHKVLSRLGIQKQRKDRGEDIIVGVLGCMAERSNTDMLKKNPHIDLIVGPNNLADVPKLLGELNTGVKKGETLVGLSNFRERKKALDKELQLHENLEALDAARSASGKSQAFVRITRGCNKFCSFCVVPRTRGPELHRHPQAIVDEVKRLCDSGAREVTLLGQTINHYVYEDGGKTCSFADLLFRIHENVPELPRLRFLTSYPRDFTDEALQVMASCERICKYLHIPAQSGSNRILQRMNRGYTRESYLELIERARSFMPNVSILGDMIVGFPSETDEDFEASLSLLREVRYKNVFIFKYSPRPGTVANKRDADDISMDVKKFRNNRMLDVQNEIALEHHRSMIGTIQRVLVEGEAKIAPDELVLNRGEKRLTSRTTGDHIVAFTGNENLIGSLVDVEITSASMLALTGKLRSLM